MTSDRPQGRESLTEMFKTSEDEIPTPETLSMPDTSVAETSFSNEGMMPDIEGARPGKLANKRGNVVARVRTGRCVMVGVLLAFFAGAVAAVVRYAVWRRRAEESGGTSGAEHERSGTSGGDDEGSSSIYDGCGDRESSDDGGSGSSRDFAGSPAAEEGSIYPSIFPSLEQISEPPSVSPSKPPSFSPSQTSSPSMLPLCNPTDTSCPLHETFSFYVMGDVPYREEEQVLLQQQLEELTANTDDAAVGKAKFVVHVGDIMRKMRSDTSSCEGWRYSLVSGIFRNYSALPVLALPGDNEWTDCPDTALAWAHWEHNFLELEDHWDNLSEFPALVKRQPEQRENFAFSHEGVLFLGINMVSASPSKDISRAHRERRLTKNAEWVDQQIKKYSVGNYSDGKKLPKTRSVGMGQLTDSSVRIEAQKKDTRPTIRAIIIFGHCAKPRQWFDDLAEKLNSIDVPTIYIHGNGHTFEVDQQYARNNSTTKLNTYWDVQVDQGGIAPPMRVTVRGTTLDARMRSFGVDDPSQHLLGEFVKLDRRGGLY